MVTTRTVTDVSTWTNPSETGIRARLAAAGAVLLTALSAAVLPFPAAPAAAQGVPQADPLAPPHTVVVRGDARFGTGGQINGSLAAGGTISFGTFDLGLPADGTAVPAADGRPTQLLAGGRVDLSSGTVFRTNAGYAGIADMSRYTQVRDGRLLSGTDPNGPHVFVQGVSPRPATLADYHSEAFAALYPAAFFDDAIATAAQLGQLPGTVQARAGGELQLTLQPDTVNVWTVTARELAGYHAVNFGTVKPSATAPLIVNVTDPAGTGNVLGGLRFNGDAAGFSPYVTWNLSGWNRLSLEGGAELSGLVLAPQAAVTYRLGSNLTGQLIADSFTMEGGRTINHRQHVAPALGREPEPATLRLRAEVENGTTGTAAPADWTLHAEGSGGEVPGSGGTLAVAPGGYALDGRLTSGSGEPGDYVLTGVACSEDGAGPVPVHGQQVEVAEGQTLDCVLRYAHQRLQIELRGWDVPAQEPGSLPPADTEITEGQRIPDRTVTWTYTVSNTGATTIGGIRVTDDTGTGPPACPADRLWPGERMICTSSGRAA